MIANVLRRIGRALYIPAPKWLADYAGRSMEREITALEAERTSELARSASAEAHGRDRQEPRRTQEAARRVSVARNPPSASISA